ncbi:CDP-diacylglycerol--serine O-phosphatidyltransferase [Thermosyntropha lipolytica DSM 11003]|uniref:CDP-diacylglycerol--serine O-phosphatidyltransferase n=1 Tax=Thermosyntropha lipolytica DSM 11003 TaxID=1123382 RepID=A0A1M5RFI1_9FIRM|nr:CDP-diacylglycerol--serine O-phosphatidyltransferase [Thermosyntropha lipolytica]SHH24866.1 CDP-diacylglycerol--serine O-phosphatidyltransferase [Thermosyntropha lipolytica DSM 11003]
MPSFVINSCAHFLTLLNAVFGVLSIIYAINGQYTSAAVMILIAAFLDGIDGKVARKLNIVSELGKELDSLCDLVSFGVAPAVLIYSSILAADNKGILSMVITILFVICGAYRLARFNVLNISGYFVGIPITLAGFLAALFVLIDQEFSYALTAVFMIVLSLLMISTIKVKKW